MKKMKILALVMVMAFAAIGGAYALWFDTLTINETVTTGTVDVQWVQLCGSDFGGNYTKPSDADPHGSPRGVYGESLDTMDPGNPNESKNIGSKDRAVKNATGSEGLGEQDNDDRDVLEITLTNAYPGYQEYVKTSIKNFGTVPVKFELSLEDSKGIVRDALTNPDGWLIVEFYWYEQQYGQDVPIVLEGRQLDPGHEITIRIVQRVRQIAPESMTATFTYTIKAVQWNEYDFQLLPDEITFPRIINEATN